MVDALKLLGPEAAKQVQLLGIDANPDAIKVADVENLFDRARHVAFVAFPHRFAYAIEIDVERLLHLYANRTRTN